MEKVHYKVQIKAPVEKVYRTMLGLDSKSTYEQWTAIFNPTSTVVGNWSKDSRMQFVGTDENGKKGGMVSEVAENIPNKFVSVKHIGVLQDGKEVLEGPEVEQWAGGFEDYSFEENNGVTTITVSLDTTADFVNYMNNHYPKAIEKLKELCE